MCLTVREDDLKKNNKEFKNKVFYKVLDLEDTKLKAPHRNFYYKRNRWNHSGTTHPKVTNTRTVDAFGGTYETVSYGIHVFTNKREALLMKNRRGGRIVVKVLCNSKDLVSYGQYSQAVFNKVFLPTNAEVKGR